MEKYIFIIMALFLLSCGNEKTVPYPEYISRVNLSGEIPEYISQEVVKNSLIDDRIDKFNEDSAFSRKMDEDEYNYRIWQIKKVYKK